MYKYTPDPLIEKDHDRSVYRHFKKDWQRETLFWNRFVQIHRLAGNHLMISNLKNNFFHTKFFSPIEVREVPVGGYLLPYNLFKCEKL